MTFYSFWNAEINELNWPELSNTLPMVVFYHAHINLFFFGGGGGRSKGIEKAEENHFDNHIVEVWKDWNQGVVPGIISPLFVMKVTSL